MPRPAADKPHHRLARGMGQAIRNRRPLRRVQRTVQGVEMVLPWSHRLPDYARQVPRYGQNLPRLAHALSARDGRTVTVLDIGANVGDSALQILHLTDARLLCVEGDEAFLSFLRTNVGDDPRVAIEPSLLLADSNAVPMAPVRSGGTTRFEPGQSDDTAPTISVDTLRNRHPGFDDLRLVKSDTDGLDVLLVPAVARAYAHSRPVLFFEYDHALSRKAGNDPQAVWGALADLGYRHVRVWDNFGDPLATHIIDEMVAESNILDQPSSARPYDYWDVAVVHGDDRAGWQAALDVD